MEDHPPKALDARPELRNPTIALVLSEIRRRGAISRTDIAEALMLSPATVTAVSAGLIGAGYVLEGETVAAAGRGRPKVRLSVNPDRLTFGGAKLNDGALTVAVLNFAGEVIDSVSLEMPPPPVEPEALARALCDGLDRALAETDIQREELAGLGLGVPGFVELATGVCHWSPLMTPGPIALRPFLSEWLGLPVFVDNDANLATLAELWFGRGRGVEDFLVVTVEHGVGLGAVLDGRLFRGCRGLGVEFGHTKVEDGGAACRCGQRGCLEAYVADYALIREAVETVAGFDVDLRGAEAIARLEEYAEDGDKAAQAIYRRAGRMLGIGLANLVNLFDPPLVIVSGERLAHQRLMTAEVEAAFEANRILTDRAPAELTAHRWGDELWARGAAALAIEGAMGGL